MFKDDQKARIVGNIVLCGKALEAPFSGRKCAYYYVRVKETGDLFDESKIFIEDEDYGEFVIQDGNYCAIIDTGFIKSYIVEDRKYLFNGFSKSSERLEKFLRKHGEYSSGFLGLDKHLSIYEGILAPGERVSVSGKGRWKQTERTDIPAPYGKILAMIADGNKPVYLSDDPDTVKQKNMLKV